MLARWSMALVTAVTIWVPRSSCAQVTAVKGLQFGTVISGTTTSVPPTASGALEFKISGLVMVASYANLTLPTTLARTGGGNGLPVSFCTTCGVYRLNNNNPVGGTVFNPNVGFSGLALTVNTTVYVWLGGAANPPLNQPAGSYTGTVVLTIGLLL